MLTNCCRKTNRKYFNVYTNTTDNYLKTNKFPYFIKFKA